MTCCRERWSLPTDSVIIAAMNDPWTNETDGGDESILSVSELTAQLKTTLETAFLSLWVAGEISNFSRPQSGHCYLTLKDGEAQLRAVVWRSTAARLDFDLHDGLEIVCQGGIDLYAPRGSYQLVIRKAMPKGMGALELALRKLKDKLQAEGLFEAERKRPLNRFPHTVAFVTSPTGAALRDFLQVLGRRWRGTHVLVVPTRVQGEGAAQEIAAAIRHANRLPIDTLVVGRGGGSLEDLWAFNEEPVVRAVAESNIPVVSAVGHEIDVTLCDLAADVRALTPSEAAELVVPSSEDIQQALRGSRQRLANALHRRAEAARETFQWLAKHAVFTKPFARVHDLARKLDETEARANRAVRRKLEQSESRLESAATHLESLSPLAVLGRGYSLTYRAETGELVRDAEQLADGEMITSRLHRGEVRSRVERE